MSKDKRSHHDMGGQPAGKVEPTEHDYAEWERRVDAMAVLLWGQKGGRRLMTVDEHRKNIEALAPEDYDKLSYYEKWVASTAETLVERGVVSAEDLGEYRPLQAMEGAAARGADRQGHPHAGRRSTPRSRTCAAASPSAAPRSWRAPGRTERFQKKLLENGTQACESLGLDLPGLKLVVVENTPEVHNVIVCTLCSCYPRMLLGIPPDWYKSFAYRSRMVKEPRKVLSEFNLAIPGECGYPGPRLHRRHALHGAADASRRHRRLGRGAACRHRHAQLHGRGRRP